MSASIPVSVPVFTTLQDDIDYVLAADQNTPNDEITALATMVGMLGKAQSWGIDYISAMKNAKGPICTKKDVDEIYVSAGVVWIANSGQTFRMPRRNTAVVTVSAANLDTGTMAVGYYYIYAVADSAATTFTVKFSASASAPTGLTNFELIGWFYNETIGVLDITSGFVGNVKSNNRDVPNMIQISSVTPVSDNTGAYVNDTLALARFYSSGRPVLVLYNAGLDSGAVNFMYAMVAVNGVDQTDSEVIQVANGGGATAKLQTLAQWAMTPAAGAYSVQGRYKSGGTTTYVNSRVLTIVEL